MLLWADALASMVVTDNLEAVCQEGASHREVLGVSAGERTELDEGCRLQAQNGAVHLAGWLNSVGTEIEGSLKAHRELNVRSCSERSCICSPATLGQWMCD